MTPKWAREIIRFLSVKPQFALWGNVFDVYPMEVDSGVVIFPLHGYLRKLLAEEGYSCLLVYEPIGGFVLYAAENVSDDLSPVSVLNEITGVNFGAGAPHKATLTAAADIIEKIVRNERMHCAVMLSPASRFQDVCKQDADEFFYRMLVLSMKATAVSLERDGRRRTQFYLLFWVLNKENDMPAWYLIDNAKIKVLPIPKPDNLIRRSIVEACVPSMSGWAGMSEDKRREHISVFVDQTSGLFAGEIVSITQICRKENLGLGDIKDGIRRYKLGIVENPWTKLDREQIAHSEEFLSERVMGQSYAVKHASDIVKRSAYNLSGSQYSASQRPKGVLFFAGPTGVGKTELAKSITELIFGSPTNYIRFDMSEFGHEHADQRLVGAPPGYVGYDIGGELTNAVKQNPFSVILFDEIEKAHRKIFDLFLQILDDGRLTSGRGETVYFSESLIIFTSNLGVYKTEQDGTQKSIISPKDSYEFLATSLNLAIRNFFTYTIGRPEILNRIGENIVVFDFIRKENGTAKAIFDKMLSSVQKQLAEAHAISLAFKPGVRERITEYACENLDMGGRGIGNALERILVNPLSRGLFECGPKRGDTLEVTDISFEEQIWSLSLERRKS